jgi:hypothetical protein
MKNQCKEVISRVIAQFLQEEHGNRFNQFVAIGLVNVLNNEIDKIPEDVKEPESK